MEEACFQTSKTAGSRGRGKHGKRSKELWEYGTDDETRVAMGTFSGTEPMVAHINISPLLPPTRSETEPKRARARGRDEGGRGKRRKSSDESRIQEAAGATEIGDGNLWANSVPPLLPWTGAAVMAGLHSFQASRGFSSGEQSGPSSFVETQTVREAEIIGPRTGTTIGGYAAVSCPERGPNLNLSGNPPSRNDPATGSSKRKGVRKTLNEIRQQAAQPIDRLTAASAGEDASSADPGRPKVPKRYHRELPAATTKDFTQLLPDLKIIWDWQSYCPYASFSPRLRHIYEDKRPQVSSLPLFGSSHVTACTDTTMADFYDFVINVGGSVWALDWCPRRQECQFEGFREEFLAVGAHPHESPTHRLGEPVFGRGLIQIWAFSVPSFVEAQICFKSGEHNQRKKRNRGKSRAITEYQAHDVSQNIGVDEASCVQKALVLRESPLPESWISEKAGAIALDQDTSRSHAQAVPGERLGQDMFPRGDDSWTDQRNSTGGNEVEITSGEVESSASEMTSATQNMFYLPQMVLGLAHDGGVTWDAKWQPSTNSLGDDKNELLRLGYLASLFGDGSLQVFDVPLPSIVYNFKACENRDAEADPVVAKINPVFKCSGLPCRGSKSMPLILEWSSPPHDFLLVGCHDGVIALWRFSPSRCSDKDTRPLMCFVADSAPIRALAWSPDGSGTECRNVIATAGHSGRLQLWDLRDPFHPIWDLILSKGGCILSMDWLSSPRSIVLSMDDGSVRTLSLDMASSDTPVTGKPCTKTLGYGLHSYFCASLAVWTVHVSRTTGLAMCGGEDGSVIQFQLTEKNMKQERVRTRQSHRICGRFVEDIDTGVLSIICQNTPIFVQMKKFRNDNSQTPLSKILMTANCSSPVDDQAGRKKVPSRQVSQTMSKSVKRRGINQERRADALQSPDEVGESLAIVPFDASQIEKLSSGSSGECCILDDINDSKRNKRHRGGKNSSSIMMTFHGNVGKPSSQTMGNVHTAGQPVETLPPKTVSIHRVRWNQNKGSDSWLCFGGAAGIVRCRVMCPKA